MTRVAKIVVGLSLVVVGCSIPLATL